MRKIFACAVKNPFLQFKKFCCHKNAIVHFFSERWWILLGEEKSSKSYFCKFELGILEKWSKGFSSVEQTSVDVKPILMFILS